MVNEIKIKNALNQHFTPSYIYDGNQLISNYKKLESSLPNFVDIFYALKANPNLSLVKLLVNQGACTEVCSLTELEIAIKAGSKPSNIIFLGPSKKDYELQRAISLGIYAIVVESEMELERISKMANEQGKVVDVAIRINPNFSAEGSPWKMGGRPTQFGIDEKIAIQNFGNYLKKAGVNIKGIHVYNGTNILDAKSVFENTKYILSLFEKISAQYHHNFTMVDVGGGMGIPYFQNQEELNTDELSNLLIPLFTSFRKKFPQTRIIMESGRYIVGSAGYFAARVNNIKTNHESTFVITDGGTNCHSSSTGAGRVVKRNFPMKNLTPGPDAKEREYQVTGPLCSPDDIIGRNIKLKEVKVNDIILVALSGAYGLSSSPGLFHSHGHPAEILIYNDEIHLIRERESTQEILKKHLVINFN